jgi:hypothetical protein
LRDERGHGHGSIIAGPARVITFGQARRSFRFDLRYRALLGGTRDQLEQQINDGFPFLPAGCSLQLDRVASERVLANLRESLPTRRPQLLAEARRLGRFSLAGLLEGLGMELGEFYKLAGSWALLQRELGWVTGWLQGSPATMKSGWGGGSPAACCIWTTPSGCVAWRISCSARHRPIRRASIPPPSAAGAC